VTELAYELKKDKKKKEKELVQKHQKIAELFDNLKVQEQKVEEKVQLICDVW